MKEVPTILSVAVAAAVWCIGVILITNRMPVGLNFDIGTKGYVSSVSVFPDGKETESAKNQIGPDGLAATGVDRSARTFYFKLYPDKTVKAAVWPLRNIRVCFVPAISANLAARFCMREKLYDNPPAGDRAPLLLNVRDGAPLDLPNAFPYILRAYRAAALVLAWLPLVAIAAFVMWRFLAERFAEYAGKLSGKPSVFIPAAIATAFLTLPPPVTPASPGLDPSWIWVLNYFSGTDVFGSGLVFTYGPLGFLIFPQVFGANVAAGLAVNLVFSALFVYLVLLLRRKGAFPALALLLMWILPWPNGMEWKWCMVSIMSCAFAALEADGDIRSRERLTLFAAAALTATLQSFVKFSSCVNVVGQQLFIIGIFLLRKKREAVPGVLAYLISLGISFAGFALLLFGSAGSFADWIRGSLEIASGYNLVMACDKPLPELLGTFAVIAVFAVFVFTVRKKHLFKSLLFWVMFAPFLFCSYKYAVVRQSAVPLLIGIACLAVLLPVAAPELARRALAMSSFFAFSAVAWAAIWCGETPRLGCSASAIADNLRPRTALERAKAAANPAIESERLPKEWLEKIGTNRVMIAGWDMGPAMSGGLNLVPFPAMQTYSAYTPWLDGKCAERVEREEDRIRFILAPADPWTFDSRNIYFDTPRLWDSVKRNFAFAGMNRNHVLLERRAKAITRKEQTGERVFSEKRTAFDRLAALLFRPARTMAMFSFENGTQYTCYANIEALYGTPVPETLPLTPADMPSFFGADSAPALPKVTTVEIRRSD